MNKKMNILFILSDDQGAWSMRCAGNDDIFTPNLDLLSQEGVRYENFFCASPVCSPARASIVTGEIPSAHGVHDWIDGGNLTTADYPYMEGQPHFRKDDVAIDYLAGKKTYIEHLAENGYRCGLSGKWHLGDNPQQRKGFEKWFTIPTGGSHYYHCETVENNEFRTNDGKYITDIITDKALEYIEDFSKGADPFYLSLHYTAPHSPWNEENHPKPYLDLYRNCQFKSVPNLHYNINQMNHSFVPKSREERDNNLRGYFAAITSMDYNIGRVIEKLKQLDLYENTVIIFTSDNGMNMGHHGVWGKGNGTYPPNMYDESVKVPFIIKAPFIDREGYVNKSLHSHYDLYQTILEIAEIEYTNNELQPGKSFYKELINNKESGSDVAIFDEYAIIHMFRDTKYKYIKNYKNGEEIFYDLTTDPEECYNVINSPKYRDTVNEFRTKEAEWFKKYSVEKFSGKAIHTSGGGQKNYCYLEDSFDTDIHFVYDVKDDDYKRSLNN